jgi:hypothetical protein
MAATAEPAESADSIRWQRMLLPLMSSLLVALAIFFFAGSLVQLFLLQNESRKEAPVALSPAALGSDSAGAASPSDRLALARFRAEAELEVQLVSRRYHQATVLLMARVWVNYLGFVTGMILALVGAAFILGKLRDPGSELALKGGAMDWAIKTASPGVVLVVLGTGLMLATLVTNHRIDVTDRAIYLGADQAPAVQPPAVAPLQDPYATPKKE